jgi:hypothetical protein
MSQIMSNERERCLAVARQWMDSEGYSYDDDDLLADLIEQERILAHNAALELALGIVLRLPVDERRNEAADQLRRAMRDRNE